MSSEYARWVSELRRSSAASPRPGRRRSGPLVSDWEDDRPEQELPELTELLSETIARQQAAHS